MNKKLLRRMTAMLLCVFLCVGANFPLVSAALAMELEVPAAVEEETENSAGGETGEGGEDFPVPPPVCVCEVLCVEAPNEACPVCAADMACCTGTAPEPEPAPVCICEVRCAGDAPNADCPVCVVDAAGCTGPEPVPVPECTCETRCKPGEVALDCPVCLLDLTACTGEEVPICICETRCELGAVRADCPICKNDLTVCAGKAPDPLPASGVSIQITPPAGWFTGSAEVEVCITDETGGGFAQAQVKIEKNGSWRNITDELWRWEAQSYGAVAISENCTVYVSVTGYDGQVYEKSRYIECFDRAGPTLRARVDGQLLRAEATDLLSGVYGVYIDGMLFTGLVNGTLDVPLRELDGGFEQLALQAVDFAGNKSQIVQVKNPNYQAPSDRKDIQEPEVPKAELPKEPEPSKEDKTDQDQPVPDFFQSLLEGLLTAVPTEPAAPEPEPQPPAQTEDSPAAAAPPAHDTSATAPAASDSAAPPKTPAVTQKPSPTQNPSTQKSAASTEATPPKAETAPSAPLTPSGQGEVVDNVTNEAGKEFFTIATKDDSTFYLIIDKQWDSENVYFLDTVKNSDLLSLAEPDTPQAQQPAVSEPGAAAPLEAVCTCGEQCVPGAVDAGCPVCVLDLKNCTGTAPAADPEPDTPQKQEKGGSVIPLVLVAVLAAGGAGFYFKIYKPRHDLDGADDFDDLTEDEETVNEDALEPAFRQGPDDEPVEPDDLGGYAGEEPEDR